MGKVSPNPSQAFTGHPLAALAAEKTSPQGYLETPSSHLNSAVWPRAWAAIVGWNAPGLPTPAGPPWDQLSHRGTGTAGSQPWRPATVSREMVTRQQMEAGTPCPPRSQLAPKASCPAQHPSHSPCRLLRCLEASVLPTKYRMGQLLGRGQGTSEGAAWVGGPDRT